MSKQQIYDLRAQLSAKEAELQQTKAKRSTLQNERDAMINTINDFSMGIQQNCKSLQNSIDKLELEKQQLQKRQKHFKREPLTKEQEGILRANIEKLYKYKENVCANQDVINQYIHDIQHPNPKDADCSKNIATIENEIGKLQKKLTFLKTKLSQESNPRSLQRLNKKVDSHTTKIDALSSEIKFLSEQLYEAKTKHDAETEKVGRVLSWQFEKPEQPSINNDTTNPVPMINNSHL